MLISAGLVGAFCLGVGVGVLIGIAIVWESRFREGRAYGYRQGCESAVDNEMIARIRGDI